MACAIYTRTRKYMRAHLFSGARIYDLARAISGARHIYAHQKRYECASISGARIYDLARAIYYRARAIY